LQTRAVVEGEYHTYFTGHETSGSTSDLVTWLDAETDVELRRYDQSEGKWIFPATAPVAFRDADIYIGSDDDGHLDLHADTVIDLNNSVQVADSGGTAITLTDSGSAGSSYSAVICQSKGQAGAANIVGAFRTDNLNNGKRWLWKHEYDTDDLIVSYDTGSCWVLARRYNRSADQWEYPKPVEFSGNVGFYGTAPVSQPAAPSDATTQDLSGSDAVDRTKLEADLNSCKTAINTLIDRLQTLGLLS